jgi:calcineurin-like phosphoesterase family protein
MDEQNLEWVLKPPFWVTSDNHFHHKNIAIYEPIRPEDCDKVMIERWNEVVGENDIIFHLGDIALGKKEQFEETVTRLSGRIFMIRGNHDRSGPSGAKWYRDMGITLVPDNFKLTYKGYTVTFSHRPDPAATLYPAHLQVHGHIHSKEWDNLRHINVSVEKTDFRPVAIEALLDERIELLSLGE